MRFENQTKDGDLCHWVSYRNLYQDDAAKSCAALVSTAPQIFLGESPRYVPIYLGFSSLTDEGGTYSTLLQVNWAPIFGLSREYVHFNFSAATTGFGRVTSALFCRSYFVRIPSLGLWHVFMISLMAGRILNFLT